MLSLLLPLFSACGGEEAEPAPALQSLAGFETDAVLSGGGTLMNANLNSLRAEKAGESDIRITLSFIGGSRMSAGTDEREVRNVPAFTVSMLPEPARLVVSFESILYWDYLRDLDLGDLSFLRGSFGAAFEGSERFNLYIQLAGDAAYRVKEESDHIEILLRPIVETAVPEAEAAPETETIDIIEDTFAPDGQAFYLVANAFSAFTEGVIGGDRGIDPVLSADLETPLLISKGFSDRSSADRLMADILNSAEGLIESDFRVELMEKGALPAYDESMEYEAAYDQQPIRIDGTPTALEPAIPDGLFLAVTPDKKGLLYTKRIREAALGETYEYEQLCVMRDGETKPLLSFEFHTVESAVYSPDGRKLAVLERADESAHLYVFDLDTKELSTDLTEMGFGDTVSAYVWDSMGGRVFSIGGSGEIAVHQYDFNVPSENKRHTVVDRKGVDESSLAFFGGEVYFCESGEGGAVIYRVKPEGGMRRSFAAGEAFAISPDGRYMAVSDTTGETASFSLLNMQDGSTVSVAEGIPVSTFFWAGDATRLYYIENRLSGSEGEAAEATETVNDAYPYRLWVYDVEKGVSHAALDLPYASIAAGADAKTVYLSYVDSATMGEAVRATYAVRVD
ncbi:MAG: hypothetical protein E7330_04530 [Clostridiales bacterium]|nr:hypothetical protein [Clostridiales bacterium]